MSDIAIKVETLGKSYLIGHNATQAERYTALRDVIARNARNLARKTRDMVAGRAIIQGDEVEEFWALKDVSFEIKQGESVGIIGRNGAGKSTLLKILSRITEPTKGKIKITGRVASLLEVGTGFHPELTGRENIFLNGAILGMTRAEINRKFDEIVAFAEVEKFLDTPVKRFSSGMYVRLAFAVAAHLEPEILVVDEVLAVGDAAFQKKSLGKMGEVAKEGRTVLFVSHNMAAVSRLCSSAIFFDCGAVRAIGPTRETVQAYLSEVNSRAGIALINRIDRKGSGKIRFLSIKVHDRDGREVNSVQCGQEIDLSIKLEQRKGFEGCKNVSIAIGVDNSEGLRVWHISNETSGKIFSILNTESSYIKIKIPKLPLVPGIYSLTLFISENGDIHDWIGNAATLNVEAGDFFGTGRLPPAGQTLFMAPYSVDFIEVLRRDA
jgi:lipopolysaccharide transport system ATP-binding protein